MFTFVAVTLFSLAFMMAIGTIAWMFLHYHDKMVAALLFQPIPQDAPVYHVRIRRPRAAPPVRHATLPLPTGVLAA
jgi:hypothetical protein